MTIETAAATEVWSGRTFAFSKAAGADQTLPENQDRITPLVWITRGSTRGIFNIQSEGAYVTNVSPADTDWATGDAVDFASLVFQPWENWANSNPPGTVGVNAAVHLITEDIYIDIVFDAGAPRARAGVSAWNHGDPGASGRPRHPRMVRLERRIRTSVA